MILFRQVVWVFGVLIVGLCNNKNTVIVSATAAAAAASTTKNVLQVLRNLDGRYFIAGGTCAAISHGITTPIDVIKTKIQSNPIKYKKMGLIGTARDIIKEDGGSSALTKGLGPTVIGYGIEGAMKFGVYEIMKLILVDMFGKQNKGIAYLVASIIAGAVASIILCPMESARILMVTDKNYNNLNLLQTFPKMFTEEGLFTSFNGIYAMLSKQVPYTFGKQVTFDIFATTLYQYISTIKNKSTTSTIKIPIILLNVLNDKNTMKWIVSVCAAFGASILACIFSQPGDVILTETYHKKPHSTTTTTTTTTTTRATAAKIALKPTQRSFVEIISTIYKNGGYSGFFTGTGARIVHVGLIITSQLVIYDIVKQLLGLPATGSH